MRSVAAGLVALTLVAAGSVAAHRSAPEAATLRFEQIAATAGLAARHHTRVFNGPHRDVLGMFTYGGASVAVGDYDNDGFDDLFVTDSAEGSLSHLYHNDGGLHFTDVTAEAGVGGGNLPQAIVSDALWLDYDNDGWRDLLVLRFGTPILYHNEGNGRFRDVTAQSGLTTFTNAIAAIAFDYDNDGRLDLLIGNYFKPVNLFDLKDPHILPTDLDNAANGGGVTLWHNAGNGRFADVTEKAGLAGHTGWTLDVGHGDFDNDGWQDLYLACDYGTDRLFMNNRDGTFRDVTASAIGYDTKKGMNAEIADYDNDGLLDVYVTNITDEYMRECNMLWRNNGDGTFSDVARETGTCETGWGWAAKFGDFDNDGWLDLFVANGLRSAGKENYIPVLLEMIIRPGVDFSDVNSWPAIGDMSWSGHQRKKLLRNTGGHAFKDVAAAAGVNNDLDGRGIGVGDFDNDGRLDLVQTNANQPLLFYRNTSSGTGHWIELRLVGTRSNRDAVGARVTVETASGLKVIREVNGGNGYASQSSQRVHVGLGVDAAVRSIDIRWPSGTHQQVTAPVDAVTTIREPDGASDDEVRPHRNLGKAFYENPTTHAEAVDEFRKALDLAPDSARERVNYGLALLRAGDTEQGVAELERVQRQDPSIPHTWFNLGVAYKKASDDRRAIAQFERMIALVPEEPISHYNLGFLYKLAGRSDEARKQFDASATLDPNLAAPHFQLFNIARDAGQSDAAALELTIFQRIKRQQANAAVREDLDWSRYAEILDPIDARDAREEAPAVPLKFRDLPLGAVGAGAGLLVLDAGRRGRPDLLAWSRDGVRLFRNGDVPVAHSGLEAVSNVRAIAAGDYDNDGLPDLCIVTDGGAALFVNRGGTFERAPIALPPGQYDAALWVDYDHDYDLDLLLVGDRSALMRNNGRAGFSDQTADFPFVAGRGAAAATLTVDADQTGHDVVIGYADRMPVLFRDRLAGKYEAQPVAGAPAGVTSIAAQDLDADGNVDLIMLGSTATTVLLNRGGRFEPAAALPAARGVALGDFENHGLTDLLIGGVVFRNVGLGRFSQTTSVIERATAVVAADFDQDGRTDLAAISSDGSLHVLSNETVTGAHWIRVGLRGVRNAALAPGAQVEVRSGARYQKKTYAGVPLLFGLRAATAVDTVRITWPNGLIQNEMKPQVDRPVTFKEAQRLSGSCPMIFAWNGHGFQFITDVLGVAPLGASSGDGTFFPVDHDEYVQIPGAALARQGDAYEIRITEELREVSYLDQIQLIATDHPANVDLFTNDKFKSPPFPDFRLFGVTRRIYPVRAEQGGRDVRPALLSRDRAYVDGFRRDLAGVAELHALDLDFGDAAADNRAILVLNGWVDWADGSTFLAAAQADARGLILPYLQVKDAAGRWTTVVDDMGMPAGKPKTIVVDLTGKFLSASREVRIMTNLCLYWDEIFLSEDASAPAVVMTRLDAASADLHFRGFSTPAIHPERTQPESFDYAHVMLASMWNPTPGFYTRYGDVRSLVASADDRPIIMGSGDELRLRFGAAALPPIPQGWTRDFLLLVDGWAKDADANTAFSQSVDPLPFHAMSAYPYPAQERYPDDEAHRRYREEYNTRPALKLVRPLSGRSADERR
jgi:tetratricopeptide (TPR) repeat protein